MTGWDYTKFPIKTKRLHEGHEESRPVSPQNLPGPRDLGNGSSATSLQDMPVELLLHITEFLPPSSKVCLFLVNRAFAETLRTQNCVDYLSNPRRVVEKMDLLYCLARDTELVVCAHCVKLHPKSILTTADIERQSQLFAGPTRRFVRYDGTVCNRDPSSALRYKNFKLAMDNYRLGSGHGIPLETLAQQSKICLDDSSRTLDIAPRVVANELYLRMKFQSRFLTYQSHFDIKAHGLVVCPHHSGNMYDSPLPKMLACRLGHRHNRWCHSCSGPRKCNLCMSEFEVGYKNPGDGSFVVIVTVYKRIGRCDKPFVDAGPNCHTLFTNDLGGTFSGPVLKYQPRSIKNAFKRGIDASEAGSRPSWLPVTKWKTSTALARPTNLYNFSFFELLDHFGSL